MKKVISLLLLFAFLLPNIFAMKSIKSYISSNTIKVATNLELAQAISAKGGIIDTFSSTTGIDIDIVGVYDTSELVSKIKSCTLGADVILGVNNIQLSDIENQVERAEIFDYSFLTFCFDDKSKLEPPTSFYDLLKPQYKNKVILIDPRTSSVGQELLRWSVEALGEERAFAWWQEMIKNSYMVATSWSQAYSAFAQKEAPIVISYSTSPIVSYLGGNFDIIGLNFIEGSIATDEYVAIMKSTQNIENSELFLNYIVENSDKIALKNYMYPVKDDIKLPSCYNQITKPKKFLQNKRFADDDKLLLRHFEERVINL